MSLMFDSTYVDTFDIDGPCEQLMNFATGMLATPEVQKSLLECLNKSEKSVDKFIKGRLMPEEGKEEEAKCCFAPM